MSTSIAVAEFYEGTYRPDKHALPKSHGTRDLFRTDIRNFNSAVQFQRAEAGERLRPATLEDFTDERLKAAMAWQVDRGRTAATANRMYRVIRALWRDAHDRGLVATLPKTKPFKEPKRKPQCWSVEEYSAIMTAAEAAPGWVGSILARDFFPAYFWFTYATGARQGVTLAFPAADFDAASGAIVLPAELQKQGADQNMELLPECVAALQKLRSAERGLDRLFGDWSGSITHFNKRLRKIIVAAGLRKTMQDVKRTDLSHKIRRTFATHVCAASDKETARVLLGHSHPSVTKLYLDERFLPHPSARDLVPPLLPRDPGGGPSAPPPAPQRTLRIHRPERDDHGPSEPRRAS